MFVVQNICTLALRRVVMAASLDSETLLNALNRHFTDHSARLAHALHSANDSAWQALIMALAGESLWERVRTACTSAEDKAFRPNVRVFLDAECCKLRPTAD